ncbi:hypothetical protein LA52FAK_45410 [Desulforhopalus sp. 52FAK]
MRNCSLFTKKTKCAILIVNVFLLLIGSLLQLQYQIYEHKKDFAFTINNVIKKDISDKLSTTKGILATLVSYYQASADHSPASFAHFSGDLIHKYPFLTAIGFAKLITDSERESFEESMQKSGVNDFRINRFDVKSADFVQAENHQQYAPIVRVEPSDNNTSQFYGYDLLNSVYFSQSIRRSIETSKIVSVYNFFKAVDLQSYYFLKATYTGESIPDTQSQRLEKASGVYIINVNINMLLLPIKEQFSNWNIEVSEDRNFLGDDGTNFLRLNHYEAVTGIKDLYLHVQQPLKLKDFNLFMPLILMMSMVALQVMAILLWRKDLLIRRELNYQAKHDDLTKLPNRTFLRDKLDNTLEQLKSSPQGEESIAIVFVDLDHFKEVNDSYGHQFGDKVLIEIARRFQETLRKTDTICRLGGDEFIVLLDTVGDNDLIVTTIERIMGSMTEPIVFDSRKVYLSASFGVATFPQDGEHVSDLLKNADTAMYKAKKNGRNRYCFYSVEMTEKAIERLTLETKLRQAIKDEAFDVYYQPQIDGVTGDIVGLEALIRWHDGDGFVSPDKFIPIAEETGLVVPLDLLVMEKAIGQFGKWYEAGFKPGVLALNLSTRQLQHPDFIDILDGHLEKSGCRPEWLELEITEGHIMSDPEAAIIFLQKLAEKNIRLTVDDFGTGYSSLSYLKKLPLNKLKIDRTFVQDLPENEDDVTLIITIIALALNLNLGIIAEGVETEEQRALLVKLGCANLQGFYYSPARKAEEIEGFLQCNPFSNDLKN